ncbi:MAG TPA: prolyl oligopeptidase family serine peptidase, partial [Acidobacteriota bacterium]|nr:prolyl oligopeptidase family serine peptidase [Acidobacteriota bacterium]
MHKTFPALLLALSIQCAPQTSWQEQTLSLRPEDPGVLADAVLDNLESRAAASLEVISHASTPEEASEIRADLRPRLWESLGLDQFPWPPDLKARTVGVIEREGYKIEKLVYETLPDTLVPAHLYLPARTDLPAPSVVFYPGHWVSDSKARPNFQAFCINMARLGFVVLSFDPFGQGERGVSWRDHRRTSALLVGVSQQGFAVHETRCAIEYLVSRKEVDPRRIGITGASGGGYNSWMVAALDDRVSVAVPVVGTSDFLEQIRVCRPLDWYKAKEHCHFVPHLIRYANNHELVAAVAPKPLLIIAASEDQSFPVAGVRNVFAYGKSLYRAFGKETGIAYFEDSSIGHGYQKKKREAAYGWFLKWMMKRGDGAPYPEPETESLPWDSTELRCFPPGENQPAGPGMVRLVKEIAHGLELEGGSASPEQVFGALPAAPDTSVKLERREVQRLEVRTESGLLIPGFLYSRADSEGLLLVVDDQGKEASLPDPFVTQAVAKGWAVCGVDPRGIGELSVEEMGWVSAVSLLLGENFVWRQAWDLRMVLDALVSTNEFKGRPVVLYGRGDNASLAMTYVLAQYAQLKDSPVTSFVLRDCFVSYRHYIDRPDSMQWSFSLWSEDDDPGGILDREIPFYYFAFGALRSFDIPDLLASAAIGGTIVDPINGDWEPLPLDVARKM